MSIYVTDTHPLVWYATGRYRKLSRRALAILRAAEAERALIYVPAMVLLEISLLAKRGTIAIHDRFESWTAHLLAKRGFDLAPLDPTVIARSLRLGFADVFDSVIVATAQERSLPLLTRDEAIADAQVVETAW